MCLCFKPIETYIVSTNAIIEYHLQNKLTSSTQFQFSASLCTLLIVPDKALIHALVFLLHRLDAQHRITVSNRFAVFHPGHRLDGIAGEVAREHGRTSEVDDLTGRIDFGRQRSGDGEHSFDTFAAYRIVNDA